MNRFDIEFWNGSLKSSILIKREVEKLRMVILTDEMLLSIREIAKIVPFINHSELRTLFEDLNEILKSSSKPSEYVSRATEKLNEWGRIILESQKYIVYGIESYKILRSRPTNEQWLDLSAIYSRLGEMERVKKLLEIAKTTIKPADITRSIIEHRFATYVGRAVEAKLYAPVPPSDLDATYKKILTDALT